MNAESNLITVPLSRLQLSPRNVRKTGGATIEDLAASIHAHGLGQNLIVTRDAGDAYAVEAGGRRLKALQLLASDGRLAADFAVPCKLVPIEQAAEVSLAENQLREAMHPADQFQAIKSLVDSGLDEGEVAARFGVTRLFVRQRMKLAKVSPKIIADYRAGKTTLEIVEACALSNDIPRQERAYKASPRWADGIRSALTQGEIESTDERVKFVGLEAYQAAGGPVHEDLFIEGGVSYLRDAALLDRLFSEKLEAEADKVRAEGWGWVEVGADLEDWRYGHGPEKGDKAKFGALVTVSYRGELQVSRWRMKPGSRSGASTGADKGKPKDKSALSADMTQRLELHRAAAIREHIAAAPKTALCMLIDDLLAELNIAKKGGAHIDNSLSCSNQHGHDGGVAKGKFDDLLKAPARLALAARIKDIEAAIGASKHKTTAEWIASLSIEKQLEVLALCYAATMQRNGGKPGTELAAALGVDMAKWWTPTPDTFLSVVSKPVLAAAVADVAGKAAGEQLLPMKKDAAIAAAAQHLAGKGWLPKPLRGPGYALDSKGATSATQASAKSEGKATKATKATKPAKPAKPNTKPKATKVAPRKSSKAKKAVVAKRKSRA